MTFITLSEQDLEMKKQECLNSDRDDDGLASLNVTYCDGIWDGLMCWPRTQVGVIAEKPCPSYFGFDNLGTDQVSS